MTDLPTKDRLLDSAEKLFADKGFAETSLRELTQDACCNLAAVNYHFGSKEGLVHAVIARRIGPINDERIALLDELERTGEPTLESILRAFVGPVLKRRDVPHDHACVAKLLMQMSTVRGQLSGEHKRLFKAAGERFVPAIARALPEVEATTIFWRITFMVSVVAMSFSEPSRLRFISNGTCDASDTDEALRQTVSFLAGGLRAPAPGKEGSA